MPRLWQDGLLAVTETACTSLGVATLLSLSCTVVGGAVNDVALASLGGWGQRFAADGCAFLSRIPAAGPDDFVFAGNWGAFARFVGFRHLNVSLTVAGFACPARALNGC